MKPYNRHKAQGHETIYCITTNPLYSSHSIASESFQLLMCSNQNINGRKKIIVKRHISHKNKLNWQSTRQWHH